MSASPGATVPSATFAEIVTARTGAPRGKAGQDRFHHRPHNHGHTRHHKDITDTKARRHRNGIADQNAPSGMRAMRLRMSLNSPFS